MSRIMVLDTETTGLPRKIPDDEKGKIREELEYKPHILQLSYIICDIDDNGNTEIIKIFDTYIDIDESIEIDESASKVHGITRESLSKKENRMSIEDALKKFIEDSNECELIIGHNIRFDKDRILEELNRIKYNSSLWDSIFSTDVRFFNHSIETLSVDDLYYCTMKEMKEHCKIKNPKSKTGKYKNPSLNELYRTVFHYKPAKLHNSLVDIIACLRAYIYIKYKKDIYHSGNKEIKKWIDHMFYAKFIPKRFGSLLRLPGFGGKKTKRKLNKKRKTRKI